MIRSHVRCGALLAAPTVLAWMVVAGCSDGGVDRPSEEPSGAQRLADEGVAATDFTLEDQHGRTFRLSEERGRPVLLYFGYTHCPDICPAALSGWTKAAKLLGPLADEVTFAFVTVDGERDTAARLAKHLAVFDPRFLGLWGSAEKLESVYAAYDVAPKRIQVSEGAGGYVVDHPTQMLLLDPQGRLIRRLSYQKHPIEIAAELRRLLGVENVSTPAITVRDAWSWPTASGKTEARTSFADQQDSDTEKGPGVVYVTVRNDGDTADRLLSARCDVCAVTELHETVSIDGRMRMRHLPEGLEVPAHATIELKPGAHHIMLMRLRRDLLAGDRFDVVLTFRDAGELVVPSEVRAP